METIEQKLDKMILGKLTSFIQEHTVRIKKINIKFMSSNKKHTVERLDACYESFDRMLRGVSRDLIRVEKSVREKFSEPITEERKTKILIYINTEASLLTDQLEEELGVEYAKFGKEDLFQEKYDASLKKMKNNMDEQAQKLMASLAEGSGKDHGYQPQELAAIYEMDKTLLVNMNFINPLTIISSAFEKLKDDAKAQELYTVVKNSIRDLARVALENPEGTADNMKDRKARKRLAATKSLLVDDLVSNLQILAEHLSFPPEQRNIGVIDKVWARLEECLKVSEEGEKLIPGLKLFHDYFQSGRS